MAKRIKHKPRCNRVKHLDLTHKLSRDDTKAIAMMALHETLIIDHMSFATPSQQKILKEDDEPAEPA